MDNDELFRLKTENIFLRRRVAELEARLGIDNTTQTAGAGEKGEARTTANARQPQEQKTETERPAVNYRSDSAAKIALFRALFYVRQDVYALRFVRRDGNSGYLPHCLNQWKTGLCNIKDGCGKCANRVLAELSDEVVEEHLRGKNVVGGYPMLKDETCRFLAADFDGDNHRAAVAAYKRVAERYGLAAAVEISRSGKGAHAWLFFDEAISAKTARALGSGLLTAAMRDNPEISFASYDRLFPSQDTLTENGYGNLIALPLQKEAVARGASVFVDDGFAVFEDQWSYLSAVRRHSAAAVDKALCGLQRDGGVMDAAAAEDSEELPPWEQRRANKKAELEQLASGKYGKMPEVLTVTLSDRLYVRMDGLPARLINKIRLLAVFQNPEFYKRQAQRLFVKDTPRVIDCSDELSGYLTLPRGLVEELDGLLKSCGVRVVLEDKRNAGEKCPLEFAGTLRGLQAEAVAGMLRHDNGVLVAGTGFGKTVAAAKIMAARAVNTLVLTHRKQLIEQWRSSLVAFLDIPEKKIGVIGGGRNKITRLIDIATIQSLYRNNEVSEIVKNYGQVIVDECHHISAVSFEKVLKAANAKFILGLTATPIRKDGLHPVITMQCGPVRYRVTRRQQEKEHRLHKQLIIRETGFAAVNSGGSLDIQELYNQIATDEPRNDMIFEDVLAALERGAFPLLLTERREHLEYFANRFAKFVRNVIVFRGAMGVKQIREATARLRGLPETEERLVIATGRYIGEGFDNDLLDTLFLTMPISWRGTLQQYAGRLNRRHHGKNNVVIYDYTDVQVPVLMKMHRKRRDGYRQLGFTEEAYTGKINSGGLF